MIVSIIIKDIQVSSIPNNVDVTISIGKIEKKYSMCIYDKSGISGVKIPEQLTEILCQNLEGNRKFINSILSFYKGDSLDFPINIGYFDLNENIIDQRDRL